MLTRPAPLDGRADLADHVRTPFSENTMPRRFAPSTARPAVLGRALLLLLALLASQSAGAQTFYGDLTADDEQLDDGRYYDVYYLHCVGGEAFRLSLVGNSFDGSIFIVPPEGEATSSPDARLLPAWGTSIDTIAKYPGEYTVLVTSREPGTTDRYQLMLSPLTQGQWVTEREGVGRSENGRFAFGLMAMGGQGRLLAYAEGLGPTLSIQAGQAGGTSGEPVAFAQGSGVELPIRFDAFGIPEATVTLTGGRDGEVLWAHQRYVPQDEVEKSRGRTPQARIDGTFPEGSRATSFNVTLAEGQFFFAFVAADGAFDLESALEGEEAGPSHEDYRVWITGPGGQAVEDESTERYMTQVHAPAAGEYTLHIAGDPEVPATFELAYSMGRTPPAIDAPIRWTTQEGRMVFGGELDDEDDRVAGRRSETYGLPVKAGDRVVIDVWSTLMMPSIVVATPDEQGHGNQGFQGSDMHARVDFVAQQDGLCTVFITGRTADDAGEYRASIAVAPNVLGPPAADPFQTEDDTADGWAVRERNTLAFDAQTQVIEGKAYRAFEIEVDADEQVRIAITGDGLRVDVLASLPGDGGVVEGDYDAETNTCVVVLPPGTEGTVQYVALAANPGELGEYTEEIQVRE